MFTLQPSSVDAAARAAAAWLKDRGVRPGDRVAIVAGNRPEYVALTMGALRTGVIPVPVNAHLSAPDREWIIRDADPALVVTDESWPSFGEPTADLAPDPLARPMHYTSGTTGRPKGVWSGTWEPGVARAWREDESELWGAGEGDTVLVCSPLYHSAPHRITLSALLHGARVLVYESFDAGEIARAFVEEGVTGAFLVPTHLRRLLAAGLVAPHARRVLHAGEPCPTELKLRALDAFADGSLWEFYGSTEGQFTICSPDEWRGEPGTVGRAREGRELRIADPGPDGVGTVFVSAPAFARWEYWREPDKTADAWRGDAFTVGDIGRISPGGHLFLEGRREDLIISGGVNVYPAEVERVLLEHPAVSEAAVFGVKDREWGQRVCAAVVTSATVDEIRAWTRERLPGSHRPKDVLIVGALPRTPSGKVKRIDLREAIGHD